MFNQFDLLELEFIKALLTFYKPKLNLQVNVTNPKFKGYCILNIVLVFILFLSL